MPHDSPLPRVNTLGSDEGRMQHNKLIDLATKLSDKVVALVSDLEAGPNESLWCAAFTKSIRSMKKMGVSTASIDFTTTNVPVTTTGAEISTASPEVKTAGANHQHIQ
ncbi:hypothetical protein Tco_0792774 [Tanacetum coccineum]